MRVRLGNRYWSLRFSGNLKDFGSMQDGGTADSRIIRIGTWQGEQDTLDTVIHEALHCSRPELDEQAVDATARDLSRLLWRLGYRRSGT
jgi:hypothetical protein